MKQDNNNCMIFSFEKGDARPLHMQFRARILSLIESGKLAVGDMLPSRNELAKALNISSTPYHKVINELVQEGILSTRKGKGVFVKSRHGRDVPDQTVTLLVAEPEILEHVAFTEVINGVLDGLVPHNFSLKFSFFHPERPADEVREKIDALKTDGVIVPFCAMTRLEHLLPLKNKNIPVIFLGQPYPEISSAAVETDSREAMGRAMEAWANKSFTIAHIGQPVDKFYQRHISWFADGCRKYNCILNEIRRYSCDFTQRDGVEAMKRLLDTKVLPDLIIAEDDYVACGALSVLDKAGITHPKLLTVGGFLKHLYPIDQYPVVDLNFRKIGRAAAALFFAAHSGEDINKTVTVKSEFLP